MSSYAKQTIITSAMSIDKVSTSQRHVPKQACLRRRGRRQSMRRL